MRKYIFPRSFLLFAALCLAACGSSSPDYVAEVTDIQVQNLRYGGTAAISFTGRNLYVGIRATTPNCANQVATTATASVQALTCQVTAVGPMTIDAVDGAGVKLFSKTFTVPPPQVTLDTSLGKIVAELDPVAAPLSVNNFLSYVNTGFYTNTLFHRVIAKFVVQGGGFTTGPTVKSGLHAAITLETNKGLNNLRGTLAMARTSEPNSATSQFYFNLVDNSSLDYKSEASPGYAVFGKILQGLDVMDAIGAVPTATKNGQANVPLTDVVVLTAAQTL